ncbi:hypothetical protein Pelo_17285 [Pelomyxa schiedti]|nr:hypothetical protein Pelo_17285 [Pelomyxa schiedti]
MQGISYHQATPGTCLTPPQLSAKSQMLQLLCIPNSTGSREHWNSPSPPLAHQYHFHGHSCCYLAMLPLWVLVECVGKVWVMRPERRILITMRGGEENSKKEECVFFSVSWTLGVVEGPVGVVVSDRCLGWLGGKKYLAYGWFTHRLCLRRQGKADSLLWWEQEVHKGCCNQRWVAVAGADKDTKECSLFVSRVTNEEPTIFHKVREFPPANDLLSLGFFGFTEYEFESDVLEAIFLEERDGSELVCIEHIHLHTENKNSKAELINCTSEVVCECCLLENEIQSIGKPLVNRADGTYYLVRRDHVKVLNTGEKVSTGCAVEVVDDRHLSAVSGGDWPTTVSIYSLRSRAIAYLLSLGFFGFTEYDFESDVLEAVFLEKKYGFKFLCIEHIHLNTDNKSSEPYCTSQLVCECCLSENEIQSIRKPLLNRADGTYYLVISSRTEVKILVLGTAEQTPPSWAPDFDVEVVDNTHLCTVKEQQDSMIVSVYSLPELLSTASSSIPESSRRASRFDQVVPLRIHVFGLGTTVSVGCGLILSSSILRMNPRHPPEPKRPRLISHAISPLSRPQTYEFSPAGTRHQFIDAVTGTVLFSMEHKWIPVRFEIQAVPFPSPL